MKILLLILLTISLTSCCNFSKISDINEYGLRGGIKQINEFTFLKNSKLTSELKNDTILVKNKYYNDYNKLSKITILSTFDKGFISYEYLYNKDNRILKEIVKSNDSLNFIVNYNYQDSLIHSSYSSFENGELEINYNSNYEYDRGNNLKKIINKQIVFLRESGDTIMNTIKTEKYNNRKFNTETIITYPDSIEKSEKYIYKRNCEGLLLKARFYRNSKLEKQTTNEYYFDDKNNWIENKEFENDTLRKIVKREIIYK